MKFSVSTYSFSSCGLSEFDCLKKAKDMGFDAIEFCEVQPPVDILKEAYAGILARLDVLALVLSLLLPEIII